MSSSLSQSFSSSNDGTYPSDIPVSVRGNAKLQLLSCAQCPMDTPVLWLKMVRSYSWCISMSCCSCSNSWFCCTVCDYTRLSRFPDVNRRSRHHRKYHCGRKKLKSSPQCVDSFVAEDDVDNPSPLPSDTSPTAPVFSELLNVIGVPTCDSHLAPLGNASSVKFFHQEVMSVGKSGIRCLIAKAQFGLPSLGGELSNHDVDVQLLLADFIFGLTSSQRRVFPEIIRKILEMPEYRLRDVNEPLSSVEVIPSCASEPIPRFLCKAPLDYRFLRSTYVEGRDAMISNLPRPLVTMLSGHSYMSLREIVAHHLAFSESEELCCWDHITQLQGDYPIRSLFECKLSRQAYAEAQAVNHFRTTFPILFTKWSDDFEPNSQAKQNRGSAWVCTVTFCLPSDCVRPATYVVALGEKDLDHSPVEMRFNEELAELTSGDQWFYHGGAKCTIRCHLFLLAVLKDQPERRRGCCLSLGNGRFSSRWGYTADLSSTCHLLPSCPDCSVDVATLNDPIEGRDCDACANWNFDSGLMKFDPPANFPIRESDLATIIVDGQLLPQRITFGRLIDAANIAREKYEGGEWDANQTISYLSVHGLNIDFCNQLIDDLDNGRSFCIPPAWSQVSSIGCLLDVPMHLLGLGISKAIHQGILWVWLLQRRLGSSFSRSVAGKLESVCSMKLSWCKARSVG